MTTTQFISQIFLEDPQTDFIDLSGQDIQDFQEIYEHLVKFHNLKELNLSDNELTGLPSDLSGLQQLSNLNLNGNSFEDFKQTVYALKTLPQLSSLFINLHQEDQVDLIMRSLSDLEFLNGLKVEREILEEEGEYDEDDGSLRKSNSPVKEQPSEEDLEDEEYGHSVNRQSSPGNQKQNNNVSKNNVNQNDSNLMMGESSRSLHAENSLATLEAHKDKILDLDPEDLEQIALLYDNIRYLRRKNAQMKGNSDRQLASDFDEHLKLTMNQLTNEIRKSNTPGNQNNKTTHILNAKKRLIDIIVNKYSEYLTQTDSKLAGDVLSEVARQYVQLVDQTIHSLSLSNQVQKADDSQLKRIIQEKDQNLQDMTKEAERLNHELINQIDANDQIQKRYSQQNEELKKKITQLENENKQLKQKQIQQQQTMQQQQQRIMQQQNENQEPPQSSFRGSQANTLNNQQNKSQSRLNTAHSQQQQTQRPQSKQQPTTVAQPQKKKLAGPIGVTQQRVLTLKQLKDTIQDMYTQKVKFDKKCEENKMARETMEQYMYTYLNQRYGLKNLIIEWAAALINGIKTYLREDHDVALFGKILKNECDEEFRFIQMHVKDTLLSLLKVLLKDKNPFKSESEISKMLDIVQNGSMEEWMWRKIIEKMYDPKDYEVLESKFLQIVDERRTMNKSRLGGTSNNMSKFLVDSVVQAQILAGNKKMTREEMNQMMQQREMEKLTYHDFQKTILDFQLQEHEKFLYRFTQLYKEVDADNNGIINEDEFRELMAKMTVIEREDEVQYLLQLVDPYNNQRMTFSEIVHLLSSHMVPIDESNPTQTIPLLEKFVNKVGVNFQDLELEMQQRQDLENYQNEQNNHQNLNDEDEDVDYGHNAAY
ncbi:UNKNOWN [Stylonychia lemnae]|uniref:EF-hand domain-containing protein n=1 Tax=Stylonychia lemnae TaxID=5949 RepID=A0A078AF96_STYLE|nr:UNKNOWN [Stylonychia lemnae]|eukprot:CDW80904.1 UNKNOWN [Stylonychia lemnae]